MVIHYIIEVELSECYVSWVETLCSWSLYAPKTKGFMFLYFVYFWLDNIDNYSCNVFKLCLPRVLYLWFCRFDHLHKSRDCDIVPLDNHLTKVAIIQWGCYLIGSRGIMCNQLQTISHCKKNNMFFIKKEGENCTSTELWLKRSFWLVDRQ